MYECVHQVLKGLGLRAFIISYHLDNLAQVPWIRLKLVSRGLVVLRPSVSFCHCAIAVQAAALFRNNLLRQVRYDLLFLYSFCWFLFPPFFYFLASCRLQRQGQQQRGSRPQLFFLLLLVPCSLLGPTTGPYLTLLLYPSFAPLCFLSVCEDVLSPDTSSSLSPNYGIDPEYDEISVEEFSPVRGCSAKRARMSPPLTAYSQGQAWVCLYAQLRSSCLIFLFEPAVLSATKRFFTEQPLWCKRAVSQSCFLLLVSTFNRPLTQWCCRIPTVLAFFPTCQVDAVHLADVGLHPSKGPHLSLYLSISCG